MEARKLEEMEAPAAPAVPREPAFLRDNWKKFLADAQKRREAFKCIKVQGGVASITNGDLVIRQRVQVPDGFYTLNERNDFTPSDCPPWLQYPDMDAMKPQFHRMSFTPVGGEFAIHNGIVGQFLQFVVAIKDLSRNPKAAILMDSYGAYPAKRHNSSLEFKFPCQLPISGDPLAFEAETLRLALVEMLRYDTIIIAYENRADRLTPLFLGKTWEQCALLVPMGM